MSSQARIKLEEIVVEAQANPHYQTPEREDARRGDTLCVTVVDHNTEMNVKLSRTTLMSKLPRAREK